MMLCRAILQLSASEKTESAPVLAAPGALVLAAPDALLLVAPSAPALAAPDALLLVAPGNHAPVLQGATMVRLHPHQRAMHNKSPVIELWKCGRLTIDMSFSHPVWSCCTPSPSSLLYIFLIDSHTLALYEGKHMHVFCSPFPLLHHFFLHHFLSLLPLFKHRQ